MKQKAVIVGLIAILAVLLVSSAVFAEGEEPPAAPGECANCEVSGPSIDTSPAEVRETEEPPVDVLEGQISETLETDELPMADVVLVDYQGELLDMASQESADKISAADPRWKVGLTWYSVVADEGSCYPGTSVAAGTCFVETGDFITFAINKMAYTGIPTDGKLFVEAGTYTENVVIDGTRSLLNGLIGVDGSALTMINGNIYITNNINGFTLSGFTINGSVSIVNSTGNLLLEDLVVKSGGDTGINIGSQFTYHPGAVTLKEVKSSGNAGKGAQIYAMGNITITNSAFDGNSDDGLYLGTKTGTIAIQGVSASGNSGTGIRSNDFKKTVTLQQIIVNNNGNGGLSFTDPEGTGAFKIDTLYAINNPLKNGDGIYIQTKGLVTLNRLFIEKFGDNGLCIDHAASTTAISITNSTFTKNTGHGISVDSLGNILLTSVRSDENSGSGAVLNNKYTGAIGVITINSPATGGNAAANSFSFNTGGDGLWLTSTKNITLTNLDVMGNSGCGLRAETVGALSINKTLPNWYNAFDNNGSDGISLNAKGNVLLGYVGASDNNGYGVNFYEPALNVTVTGGSFDNNKYSGIRILSTGNVVLTDVGSASNNDTERKGYYYGIDIDALSGIGSVTVKNSSKTAMTWIGGNSGDGLSIGANGAISVTGVYANFNGGTGISLNNQRTGVVRPVSVSRTQGSWNDGGGLRIFTAGSVTLQDIYTDGNGAEGTQINACLSDGASGCLTVANVTLKGNNRFSGNASYGLQIFTKGAVILGQLDVRDNDGGGIYVWNRYPGAVALVTIGGTSSNFIEGNGAYGVRVESMGLITLKNLIVQNTYGITGSGAVSLLNNDITSVKGITLADVRVLGSEGTGLFLRSNGPVSLLGVDSSNNTKFGADIESPSTVRITSGKLVFSNFDGNRTYGAYIYSGSIVTISNAGASDNKGHGLYILAPNNNVTIGNNHKTHTSEFSGNDLNGIYIESGGSITLNNRIIANSNGNYGIYLTNSSSILKSITVKGVFANENSGDGLYLASSGNVALASIEANSNGNRGVYVHAKGSLTIIGVNSVSGNDYVGIYYDAYGNVSISGLTADHNGHNGISGHSFTTGATTLIKNCLLRWNTEDGLWLSPRGTVTLDGVQSLMNGGDGVDIDPTYNITTLIKNSAFMGNEEYGIKVLAGYYTISNTFYLANNLGGIYLY